MTGEYLLKAIKEAPGEAATEDILNAWADAYGMISNAFISIEVAIYEEKNCNLADGRVFVLLKWSAKLRRVM